MYLKHSLRDPRFFQIVFLGSFLIFGLSFLNWQIPIQVITVVFLTIAITQALAILKYKLTYQSILSAIISGLGLVLLLRANETSTYVIAGILSIAPKFLIRYNGKHIFNPVNFGIIITILITDDAWISPGQWGSASTYLLGIGIFSWLVLTKVKQLINGLVFLGTLFILETCYLNFYLEWPIDFIFHKFTSGSLLLFSFFMITDPRTTPKHITTRAIWASIVAVISFYLMEFHYLSSAPFWVLFFISPLTPFLDSIHKSKNFNWKQMINN
ncbi:MAG: RnfABCDGE type electron transport complex subunit D [Flavobacteriales bacterium]|nr:RnfABCDGE type electron transport complex subunit D [Flavobacteriales bacterium]